MTDTPRTDEFQRTIGDLMKGPVGYTDIASYKRLLDFARTLERELSAAQAELAKLREPVRSQQPSSALDGYIQTVTCVPPIDEQSPVQPCVTADELERLLDLPSRDAPTLAAKRRVIARYAIATIRRLEAQLDEATRPEVNCTCERIGGCVFPHCNAHYQNELHTQLAARDEQLRRIREALGIGTYSEAGYNLEGVIHDIERDIERGNRVVGVVSMSTLKRVSSQLGYAAAALTDAQPTSSSREGE